MLKLEKGKADPQLCAFWELLNSRSKHSLDLFEHLLATVVHTVITFFLPTFALKGTVSLVADLLMLLNIANQQHIAIFVITLTAYKLKNIGDVLLELLPTFEFEIIDKELADV